MFGGYVGQDRDKRIIEELKLELAKNPNNLEIKRELEKAKKYYEDRRSSALRSYSRL